MKLFIFAFTLGVAVSGLFFVRFSHVEHVPEDLQVAFTQGIDFYRGALVWLRDEILRGFWVPSAVELRSVIAGLVFCFGFWVLLVFLRGIPGFFRDLRVFFPLGK